MASVVHRAYPASLVLLGKKIPFFSLCFEAFLYFELSSLIVLFCCNVSFGCGQCVGDPLRIRTIRMFLGLLDPDPFFLEK